MDEDLLRRYMNCGSPEERENLDREIRKKFNVSDDRYYSISTWPEKVAGNVYIDMKRYRDIPKKKISKSDQK